eukprot:scaffold2561_cov262-Alexandrium_tamarense.AAC.9
MSKALNSTCPIDTTLTVLEKPLLHELRIRSDIGLPLLHVLRIRSDIGLPGRISNTRIPTNFLPRPNCTGLPYTLVQQLYKIAFYQRDHSALR